MVDTYTSYGSPTDLWGVTWTSDQINAKGFGVVIAAQNEAGGLSDTSYVDSMRINVYYTLPQP